MASSASRAAAPAWSAVHQTQPWKKEWEDRGENHAPT